MKCLSLKILQNIIYFFNTQKLRNFQNKAVGFYVPFKFTDTVDYVLSLLLWL